VVGSKVAHIPEQGVNKEVTIVKREDGKKFIKICFLAKAEKGAQGIKKVWVRSLFIGFITPQREEL